MNFALVLQVQTQRIIKVHFAILNSVFSNIMCTGRWEEGRDDGSVWERITE